MLEVLPCPRCKGIPQIKHWSYLEDDVSIYCCGVTVDGGAGQWNEYAVAMDAFLEAEWLKEVSAMTQAHFRDELPLSEDAWAELWAANKNSRVEVENAKQAIFEMSAEGKK
jgi:hypothetical protein